MATEAAAEQSAWSALWTFPSILASAFVIAWGAEAAQFLISQGLALAILAWLQTLPEFAVEAVIAWNAGKDPSQTHLAIANFTGSLRLLVGLGWPMIYFVAAAFGWKRAGRKFLTLELEDEHSIEVFGLLGPILYFVFICPQSQKQATPLGRVPDGSGSVFGQRQKFIQPDARLERLNRQCIQPNACPHHKVDLIA